MDPFAALKNIDTALHADQCDRDAVFDATEALIGWVRGGGFQQRVARLAAEPDQGRIHDVFVALKPSGEEPGSGDRVTTEQQMSYEPAVGDKVRFLMDTYDESFKPFWAHAEDTGVVKIVAGDVFRIDVDKPDGTYGYVYMCSKSSQRLPHDLMHIECVASVPTPCQNQVDVDAVIKRCGDAPSCHDVEFKVLTIMEMCRELRRYRLEEKAREADEA